MERMCVNGAHCCTTPFLHAHRQKKFSLMVWFDYKKRLVKRVFIATPHAHHSSRLPPNRSPMSYQPSLACQRFARQTGAHSRKAVSSRFAFRVALSGHPIAGQRTLLPVIPSGHLSLLWLPTLGSCGSLLACVARSLLLYRGFRFRVLLLLRNLLLLPLLGLRVATTTALFAVVAAAVAVVAATSVVAALATVVAAATTTLTGVVLVLVTVVICIMLFLSRHD